MATLTNTQISVTYVGLLKTSGNTILDSTPQQITDGSGNNSQLFLSTTKVGVGATPSGSDTLQITGTSSFSSHITLADNAQLRIGTSTDLQILHDGSDSFIINNTGDLYLRNLADDKDIIFQSDDGSGGVTEYFRLDGSATETVFSKDLRIIDSEKLIIGTDGDFQVFHNGSQTILTQQGTGDLIIQNTVNDADITFSSDDGSGGTTEYFRLDGGAEANIFSKNVGIGTTSPDKKLDVTVDTSDDGVILQTSSGRKSLEMLVDSGTNGQGKMHFYTGANLLYGRIMADTNGLNITQLTADKDIIFKADDGSGGTTEYFRVDGGTTSIIASKNVELLDNVELKIGTGNDLNIRHSGTESFIQNQTGNLTIQNLTDDGDIIFKSDDGSGGVTEYFRVDGSSEITIASKPFRFNDAIAAQFGTSLDMQIYHSGGEGTIQNLVGDLRIIQGQDDGDIEFFSDDGSGGTTEYFRVDGGDERVLFSKEIRTIDNVKIQAGTGGDLDIFHTGSNATIDNATGNLIIQNSVDDADIIFKSDDGSGGVTEYFKLDGTNEVNKFSKTAQFLDDVQAMFGNGGDLKMYHNSTSQNGIIENFTNDLVIQNNADDKDILFKSDDGSGGVTSYFELDGSDVITKFRKNLYLLDNVGLKIGNSFDLDIKHDGSDSFIANATGHLYIKNSADDADIIFQSDDGTGSLATYFFLDGSNSHTNFQLNARWVDNAQAQFGNSGDLLIYHDGSNSYITNSTGELLIQDDDTIRLQKSNGENMLRAVADGSVELYENNVKKFETTTSGVAVTGGMTLSGNVEGRKIPFVFRSSFDDSAGSTSIFVIPFDANVETTVSGADEEHIIIAPYAGELTKVQWKHVKGTLDTGFTTELFLYVNGSQQTSSGELTASSDAITWSPTSSNTFSAGDELMIAYQKSATSKDWEHVSVSVVFSFTGYNI